MRVPLIITDIGMGRATDPVPTYHQRMFLPQYLREAVHELWGIQPRVLYERKGPPPLTDAPSGRVWFALLIVELTSPTWLVWLPLDLLLLALPASRQRQYARGRLIMLGALLALSLAGVLTQPLLAPLLWPAIPMAVVAFWPAAAARVGKIANGHAAGARDARASRGR